MRRRWMLACAICFASVALAHVALARQGIIVTNDGRRLEGDVTEKSDAYSVTIHGVEMTLAKADIANVTFPDAYNKEFQERLTKLQPTDVAGRITLAREAFERRQYGLARQALDDALRIDPNNREATDLQNTIASQMRLEQNRSTTPDTRNMPTPPPNPTGVERHLLDAVQINYMRQQELQRSDRINVQFLNNVEKRFMRLRNIQFNDFNALKPVDKALKIMEEGDETMRADVKILGDPASIAEYRRSIQPVVLNGCAGSNCHGGQKGGDFILYNPADNDSVVYTDLLILMRYQRKISDAQASGVFGTPTRKMIDRGHGSRSLLAELGLPTDIAEIDHPRVQGYEFVFRNRDDLRFKQFAEWMDKSLKQPEPDYSVLKYAAPISPGAAAAQQVPAPPTAPQPAPSPQPPAPNPR